MILATTTSRVAKESKAIVNAKLRRVELPTQSRRAYDHNISFGTIF